MEVRKAFANKLDKHLGTLKLPLKFMSMLVLGAIDPDADNQKNVCSLDPAPHRKFLLT